jgi:iron complex outermembrane recepter protein
VPGVPLGIAEIPFSNLRNGATRGGEMSLVLSPVDTWRLTASYSGVIADLSGEGVKNAPSSPTFPRHQISLRSSHDFTARASFDVLWRYVSALPKAPSYATADFRLAYRWSEQVELSLTGQNLLAPQHLEQGRQQSTVTAEVPRAFHGRVTWRF